MESSLKNKNGFSTVEILFAMAIIIITISSTIMVTFSNQSILVDTQTSDEALSKARRLIENSRAQSRKDFRLINPIPQIADDIYQVKMDVETQPDLLSKKITSTVTWNTDHARAQKMELTTLVSNFENPIGANTCDSVLTGNWISPQIKNIESDFATIIGEPTGKYPITDIDAYFGKLYVTVAGTGTVVGPHSPDTTSNSMTTGTFPWNSPGNTKTSDNIKTSATMAGLNQSHYLKIQNLGFTIPPGATILGIKVEIERSRANTPGTFGDVRDSQIRIIKSDDNLGTTDKANVLTNWGTSDAYISYGNTTDLWGENWTSSDINNSNFGVAISIVGTTGSTNRIANIDHVRVTVNYIRAFYILDISSPLNPFFIGGLGGSNIQTGLNAVTVAGNYAYVATNAGPASGQFQVIDVSGEIPLIKATLAMTGVTGVGTQAQGQSIFYKNGYVYLGLTKTLTGPEFNIIDVHNPLNPLWIGGYNVGSVVNSIFVSGKFAYIGTANSQEILTLNISDPVNPVYVGGYNAPDAVGSGKSLDLVGDNLYLGRTFTPANPEFYILNNTIPTAILPTPLGTKEIGSSVNGLLIRDYLAFLISTNSQLQFWNIRNPSAIYSYATPVPLPNNGIGVALDCEGNYIYTASNFANTGSILIVSP